MKNIKKIVLICVVSLIAFSGCTLKNFNLKSEKDKLDVAIEEATTDLKLDN